MPPALGCWWGWSYSFVTGCTATRSPNVLQTHRGEATGLCNYSSRFLLLRSCFLFFLKNFFLPLLFNRFPPSLAQPLATPLASHEQVKFPVAQNRISWCRKAEFTEALAGREDGFSETLPPALRQARFLHGASRRRGDGPTSPLTEWVPGDDAVLHLPTGSRVAVVGQEGPDARAGLPFGDVEGTLIGPREGGTVVVDVIEVHQHLRSG